MTDSAADAPTAESLDADEPSATAPDAKPADHRNKPTSKAFRDFVMSKWAPRAHHDVQPGPFVRFTADRRARLATEFPGGRLVIPAGELRPRSNDTDYRFRPHSAFAHLTGLGTDQQPDAVLVIHPVEAGTGDDGGDHHAVLYFRPLADRDNEEFYADARYGEFWVGARPSLADIQGATGIESRHIDELRDGLAKDVGASVTLLVVTGASQAVESLVAEIRQEAGVGELAVETAAPQDEEAPPEPTGDAALVRAVSELRLVKDDFEIAEMRAAVAATIDGFADIVRALPRAVAHHRGERVIETAFDARARLAGNTTGYETIAAAGDHATTLHWITNDGPVRDGDLVLVDAGVEVDSLYTADITRTLPVSGRYSEVQRRVYQAVLDAADAAFATAKPGVRFLDVHEAAMQVIAERVHEWGLLPQGVTAEISLSKDGQQHRRWMVHGTSHHLGIDVHDCAQARNELYKEGLLEPGMIFTIEPGLYFKADDLAVPEEYRGIGVRIEDDVLVTADGCENLSAALPRNPDDVEAWMAALAVD
jgi:Xaa-Pro aminopeptidase